MSILQDYPQYAWRTETWNTISEIVKTFNFISWSFQTLALGFYNTNWFIVDAQELSRCRENISEWGYLQACHISVISWLKHIVYIAAYAHEEVDTFNALVVLFFNSCIIAAKYCVDSTRNGNVIYNRSHILRTFFLMCN